MKTTLTVSAVIAALSLPACTKANHTEQGVRYHAAMMTAVCRHVATRTLDIRRAGTATISSSIIDEAVPRAQYTFSVKIWDGSDSFVGNAVGVEGMVVPISIIENKDYIAKITPAVQGGHDVTIMSGTVSAGSTMFLSAVKGPFGPEMEYNILLSKLVRFDKDANGADLPCMAYGHGRGVITVGDEPVILPILVGDKTATVKIAVHEIVDQTASR